MNSSGNPDGPGCPGRGRTDLGTFLRDCIIAPTRPPHVFSLPACNGTPVHAFTTLRRASGAPQALPEEGSSMARAPVSKTGGWGVEALPPFQAEVRLGTKILD